jgi:type I restriction enzyme M protein
MRLTLENIAEIGLGASTHGRSAVGQGDSRLPLVNIKDIRVGYVESREIEQVPVSDAEKVERYVIRKNDVLVTLRGSVFRAALVGSNDDGAIISSNLAYLRLKPDAPISPMVLCAWLNSPDGKAQAELLQHGSGILSIATRDLKNMPVSIPDQDTQKKLATLIESWLEFSRHASEAHARREKLIEQVISNGFKGKNREQEKERA